MCRGAGCGEGVLPAVSGSGGGYTVRNQTTFVAHDDGAFYDPATKVWAAIPAGGPSARAGPVAVWTGTEAIVWSGEADESRVVFDDGKRFRP